ncbi:MAG: glycosyltransferase [Acidimicrobiia bacterium]
MARPVVFVTVGTDHHPFDRLVGWVDRWCDRTPGADVIVQYGTAAAPRRATGRDFLEPAEFADLLARASVVVCSGGPGAIMETRAAGLRPVVVPRRSELGEHVDDHQRAFADFMATRELITLADDEAALVAALDAIVADPTAAHVDREAMPASGIDRIAELVDALVGGAP